MLLDAAWPSAIMPYETASFSPAFSIRKATPHDLDVIVDIALAAMPLDPQWNWRFPFRGQYPEDERHFTLLKFEEFIRSTDRWLVLVAEAVVNHATVPVAFAVWDLANAYALVRPPVCTRAPTGVGPCHDKVTTPERRDGDFRRMQVWSKTTSLAKHNLFDRRYGLGYIQLQILATAPQWHRRGAATALCTWGLQLANVLGFTVTVFASPMGKKLYSRLGFHKLAIVRVRTGADDTGVELVAMSFGFTHPNLAYGPIDDPGSFHPGNEYASRKHAATPPMFVLAAISIIALYYHELEQNTRALPNADTARIRDRLK